MISLLTWQKYIARFSKKTFIVLLMQLVAIYVGSVANIEAQELAWVEEVASTYYGGYGPAYRAGVTFDSSGNSYITGCGNSSGIFVASYDQRGNLRWFKQPSEGNRQVNGGYSIAIDSTGNVYVVGTFSGTVTFGEGEINETTIFSQTPLSIFIASYQGDGRLRWVKKIYRDPPTNVMASYYGTGIGLDQNNNIYITGSFDGTAVFGENSSLARLTADSVSDIFIASYDSEGNLRWVKSAGGSENDTAQSIAVDSNGNSYITGFYTGNATFAKGDPNETQLLASNSRYQSIFLAKYNSIGDFLWVVQATNGGFSEGRTIGIDKDGNVYVGGTFKSTLTLGNAITLELKDVYGNSQDIFLASFDYAGNIRWAKTIAGNSGDLITSLDLKNDGTCYIAGNFTKNTTFGEGQSEIILDLDDNLVRNGFVARYDNNGDLLSASKVANGGITDPYGLGVYGNDTFVVGAFNETVTFGLGTPSETTLSSQYASIFLAKFSDNDVPDSFDLSLSFSGKGSGSVNIYSPNTNTDTTCSSNCTNSFLPGTRLIFTVLPDTFSVFTGWEGACTGLGPCEITMDEVKSVTATFASDSTNQNYSIRRLFHTKYGLNSLNHDNEWPNDKEDNISLDIITHALYPFQIYPYGNGNMTGDYMGYTWVENDLLPQISGVLPSPSIPVENRQPLILIHGWQADKNGDFNNRNPIELAKNPKENGYDAEDYWRTFLRYFATNEDLKKKYKIYLYQYPSYKHITFNARMLSSMLYEVGYIRNWISSGKQIKILAHSMGGLVSRSLLEEHDGILLREGGVSKPFVSGQNLLDKLITLDTPHHGSPAAVYPWMDFADNVGKDLFSPGSLDLWWDGYDAVYSAINELSLSDLSEGCGVTVPNGIASDGLNSWRPKNEWNFDFYYRDLLGDIKTIELCNNTVHFYKRPNPWLTHLNTLKHNTSLSIWKEKYIYYGGYNDSPFIVVHDGDNLIDTGVFDLGDNAWFTGVWKAGYLNDSPVPVTSSFFDTIKKNCFENINLCESTTGETISGWPDSDHIGMFWSNFVLDSTKNILKTINEGFQIRFFKDYHHDRMLNGAYKHLGHGYSDSGWHWDLITNSECNGDVYSGFRSDQIRLNYIQDTGIKGNLKLSDVSVLNCLYDPVTMKKINWKSTLEYEPLFLMLTNDLLPSKKESLKFEIVPSNAKTAP